MDKIVVQKHAETLLEYPLDKERTRIGRDPGNDISFAGELDISENHAEVLKGPAGGKVVDLDTLSGTFLNGERIKEKELRNGDRITIGDYTLVCKCGCEAEGPEEAPSEVVPAPADPAPPAGGQPAEAQAASPEESAARAEGSPAPIPERTAGQPALNMAQAEPEPGPGTEDDRFAATSILKVPVRAEEPAPETVPAEPVPESPAAAEDDRFAATSILKAPVKEEQPAPEIVPAEPAPEPSAAVPAPRARDTEDRFAVTSILKVPRKNKAAPASAAASSGLEDGVIEIEVPETAFWSKKRLTGAVALLAAAGCVAAVLTVLRSADLRGLLLPGSQISFSVVPDDAQVYVNGAAMPEPGSGVLRNLPAGRFTVKVSHPGYPAAKTIDIETGMFKRRVEIESAPGGISSK